MMAPKTTTSTPTSASRCPTVRPAQVFSSEFITCFVKSEAQSMIDRSGPASVGHGLRIMLHASLSDRQSHELLIGFEDFAPHLQGELERVARFAESEHYLM